MEIGHLLLSLLAFLFYAWGVVSIGFGIFTKKTFRWAAVSMGSAFVSFGTLVTYAIS